MGLYHTVIFNRCSVWTTLTTRRSSLNLISDCKVFLDRRTLTYVVEPKIDGVAISLTYDHGKLTTATTRGNGVEGDIVTQNLQHIHELPKELSGSNIPEIMEIRGEIFMSHVEFERINKETGKGGTPPLCQPPQPRRRYSKTTRPQGSKAKKVRDRALWTGCLPARKTIFHHCPNFTKPWLTGKYLRSNISKEYPK